MFSYHWFLVISGMKNLLIALGTDIIMDEGVSVILAKDLHELFPVFDLHIFPAANIEMIMLMTNYNTVIIIDTVAGSKPGKIIFFEDFHEADTLHLKNPHDANFQLTMQMAVKLNYPLPKKMFVLGIGIKQQMVASEFPSSELVDHYLFMLEKSQTLIQQIIIPSN